MTISQARELLGNKYEQLTDEQIQKIIDSLRVYATCVVDRVRDSSTIGTNARRHPR
ncbi:MAG TPA: hypothetical protein VF209_02745 [Patescibacteria group bacterium]